MSRPSPEPRLVRAEPIEPRDSTRLAHLAEGRGLVVRRSLLATALGGLIPLPVLDGEVAGRIRAGLYMKLAAQRHVDLPRAAADVLADAGAGRALRDTTVGAATLLALKLAWRKAVALVALGRAAEEMAATFQFATLVDHYCARLHLGAALGPADALALRSAIMGAITETERRALVTAFREGAGVLTATVLEAPRWALESLSSRARRWWETGGHPEVAAEPAPGPDPDEAAWIERAARAVESRLATLGGNYLETLVVSFETAWRARAAPGAGSARAT